MTGHSWGARRRRLRKPKKKLWNEDDGDKWVHDRFELLDLPPEADNYMACPRLGRGASQVTLNPKLNLALTLPMEHCSGSGRAWLLPRAHEVSSCPHVYLTLLNTWLKVQSGEYGQAPGVHDAAHRVPVLTDDAGAQGSFARRAQRGLGEDEDGDVQGRRPRNRGRRGRALKRPPPVCL